MDVFSAKVEEDEDKPLHLKEVCIKEEPEEQIFVKQEKEQLSHFTAVCVKREESSLSDIQIHCSPDLRLKQEIPETPHIKEEPEEQSCVKQEEEQLPQFTETSPNTDNIIITKVLSLCDISKTHNHSAEETEEQMDNSADTDNEDDWEPPASTSTAQMETEADGDHYKQVQIKDTHNSVLFTKYKSAPETSSTVTDGHTPGTKAEKRKKHECTVCKKRFSAKQGLAVHTRIHTGERPYSCSVCNKAFVRKGNLNDHMRTHTGEKPYSCSTCQRAFAQLNGLKLHERLHTGERPYSCVVCKKVFACKGNLDAHVRTHTGEKPYSCKVCNKTFIRKSQLDAHVEIHTGETLQLFLLLPERVIVSST